MINRHNSICTDRSIQSNIKFKLLLDLKLMINNSNINNIMLWCRSSKIKFNFYVLRFIWFNLNNLLLNFYKLRI